MHSSRVATCGRQADAVSRSKGLVRAREAKTDCAAVIALQVQLACASQLGAVLGNVLPSPTAHRGPWLDAPTRAAVLGAECCCAADLALHVNGGGGSAGRHDPARMHRERVDAIPYPERMTYVQWLKWRKSTESRPVLKRDGRYTSTLEEVALWKSVMEVLYDVGDEEEEEEEEEVLPCSPSKPTRVRS